MLWHIHINIQEMLENYKNKSLEGLLFDETGKGLSDKEVRKYLKQCLTKGLKVIPCDKCDNFDYQTGCKGHPDKGSEDEEK